MRNNGVQTLQVTAEMLRMQEYGKNNLYKGFLLGVKYRTTALLKKKKALTGCCNIFNTILALYINLLVMSTSFFIKLRRVYFLN